MLHDRLRWLLHSELAADSVEFRERLVNGPQLTETLRAAVRRLVDQLDID